MNNDIETLLVQFNEYFQIDYQAPISIELMSNEFQVPEGSLLQLEIPLSFRIANEVNAIEQQSLKTIKQLSDIGEELNKYLQAQAKKIDLILTYILSQEHLDHQQITQTIGGKGFAVISGQQWPVGNIVRFKLFLPQEGNALYGYGRVLSAQSVDIDSTSADAATKPPSFLYRILFVSFTDAEHDIVVRAALHQQSRQLKQKGQLS